jgi:hypothetical protein
MVEEGCVVWALAIIVAGIVLGVIMFDRRDERVRESARLEGRCIQQGGLWLRDSVRVQGVWAQCVTMPQPIRLTPVEQPEPSPR